MASSPAAAPEPTLLGVCDGELDPRRHRSSHRTNKVGGRPDWSPGLSVPCPRCAHCGAPLAQVVQVYCPLEASPYHRTLHVFACPAAECGGPRRSWRALRCQSLEAPEQRGAPAAEKEAPLAATDWCDSADDWGLEEEEGDGGGVKPVEEEAAPDTAAGGAVLSSRLQELHLEESPDVVPVFRPFFISVVDESDTCDGDEREHVRRLLREYERREGAVDLDLDRGAGGGRGGDEEKYEKSHARHGDAVFSRFMKRISRCPQQILRYCRAAAAAPLFVAAPPPDLERAVPDCGVCGGARTFELQLMPALVSQLRRADVGGASGAELEFGTVLVYTCVNSCWTEGGAVDEFCLVQDDPDQQLFK